MTHFLALVEDRLHKGSIVLIYNNRPCQILFSSNPDGQRGHYCIIFEHLTLFIQFRVLRIFVSNTWSNDEFYFF